MEKLLDWENSHLYNKLGLRWKLTRQRCDSTLMMEYVRFILYTRLSFKTMAGIIFDHLALTPRFNKCHDS